MVRVFLLVIALLGFQAAQSTSECSPVEMSAGLCPSATTTDTEVVLEVGGGTPGSGSGGVDVDSAWPDSGGVVDPFAECNYVLNGKCLVPGPGRLGPEPGAVSVTWADLVGFRPTAGFSAMEPEGWAVVGLDANFYASSEQQVQEGTLLGQSAAVRFTPVGFRWDYGDGHSAQLPEAGSPWAAAGVGEFDPTPTSHVFEASGDYTVTLVIDFVAEYRFGASSWSPVAGSLGVASSPLAVSVGTANTVLVDRECTRTPRGPGC